MKITIERQEEEIDLQTCILETVKYLISVIGTITLILGGLLIWVRYH